MAAARRAKRPGMMPAIRELTGAIGARQGGVFSSLSLPNLEASGDTPSMGSRQGLISAGGLAA